MASRLVVSLLVAVLLVATGPREPALAAAPIPTATVVQSGLVIPWDLAFAPDGTMFVTERPGRIRVYASGAPGAALVSTTTVPNLRSEHESGLNGIAVDVNFASNRFIYVCASVDPAPTEPVDNDLNWTNQVMRYRVTAQRTLTERTVIFNGARAAFQHNGCSVEMDASGHLWVGIGDARQPADAQDPDSFNGKILRMNRDGAVPADNPVLPGAGGRTPGLHHGPPQPAGHRIPARHRAGIRLGARPQRERRDQPAPAGRQLRLAVLHRDRDTVHAGRLRPGQPVPGARLGIGLVHHRDVRHDLPQPRPLGRLAQ